MKHDGTEKRQIIIKMNLMNAIDDVGISKRNKELVIRYVQGESFASLGRAYNIAGARVSELVGRYITLSVWHLIHKGVERGEPLDQLETKYKIPASTIKVDLAFEKMKKQQ